MKFIMNHLDRVFYFMGCIPILAILFIVDRELQKNPDMDVKKLLIVMIPELIVFSIVFFNCFAKLIEKEPK